MSLAWWILTLAVSILNLLWGYELTKKQKAVSKMEERICFLAEAANLQHDKIVDLRDRMDAVEHTESCLKLQDQILDTRLNVLERIQEAKVEEEK